VLRNCCWMAMRRRRGMDSAGGAGFVRGGDFMLSGAGRFRGRQNGGLDEKFESPRKIGARPLDFDF
jgi:hypothetical protein